ncbi:MAG: HAD family phosphatase [Bacteroidales bacterium]|nr:HAD family phosphatase [Bacteroidales bacterium]
MASSIQSRLFIGDKTKKIKTLIFDFGGVLIDLDKERSVKAFSELGIERIDELLSHWCQKGVFLDFEEGKISTENFLTEIKKMTSRAVSSDEIKRAFFLFLVDLPRYKLDLILKLRNHYQIFLLSNINELIYNYCLNEYFHKFHQQIEDYFDKIYLSFQLNVCKPKKEIFEKMLLDAAINPEETLFLEDGQQNIVTAQSLGINTFLVKAYEDFSPVFELPILKK